MGALLLATPSAFAFEETRGGTGAQPAAPPQATAPATKGLPLELGGTGTTVAPSTGTEVRIPGLGRLGISRFEAGERVMMCENDELVAISEAVMDSAEAEEAAGGQVIFRLLRVFN